MNNEKIKIEYTKVGDYYLPNLTLPKPRRTGTIGKYGRLKLNHMKKYNIPEYTEMLLNNELKRKEIEVKNKTTELIKEDKKKKMRCR